MASKLYVGNLSYQVNDARLEEMFSEFGSVHSAKVITDRDSGSSKGFGFVEMADSRSATAAIQGLNEREMGGRRLVVNEARPREERPSGSNRFRGPR
ncbi:MAG: RNA-binding protein [Pirellulales bacterium]